jgi:hypothetical protein
MNEVERVKEIKAELQAKLQLGFDSFKNPNYAEAGSVVSVIEALIDAKFAELSERLRNG